jgi:hypothetical protein
VCRRRAACVIAFALAPDSCAAGPRHALCAGGAPGWKSDDDRGPHEPGRATHSSAVVRGVRRVCVPLGNVEGPALTCRPYRTAVAGTGLLRPAACWSHTAAPAHTRAWRPVPPVMVLPNVRDDGGSANQPVCANVHAPQPCLSLVCVEANFTRSKSNARPGVTSEMRALRVCGGAHPSAQATIQTFKPGITARRSQVPNQWLGWCSTAPHPSKLTTSAAPVKPPAAQVAVGRAVFRLHTGGMMAYSGTLSVHWQPRIARTAGCLQADRHASSRGWCPAPRRHTAASASQASVSLSNMCV